MIEALQSFIFREECKKATQKDGYREPFGGPLGWAGFVLIKVSGALSGPDLRTDHDIFNTRANGLTCDPLRCFLQPADVKGPDCTSETFRVLKEKEIRQYGEYRTQRRVLAAWDRMEAGGEFAAMGM